MARRLRADFPTQPHTKPHAQPQGEPALASLYAELGAVLAAWEAAGAHTEQTLARMSEIVTRFSRRLDAEGVASFAHALPAHAAGFITARVPGGARPELATQHARRTAIRMLYRTLRSLDLPVADPTLDVALPPRGVLAARPLSDDEVTLCRASVQLTRGRWAPMRAVAWALGEATAVSSEITAVRLADLDDPANPQQVQLPGTRRHDPRTVPLTAWGRRIITERVRGLQEQGAAPETLLAYGGRAPAGGAKAQASVCNALREILNAAGLCSEPDVRPSSLRHWAGRTAYDAGTPIEAVARLLGHRSLDATAEDIALAWRAEPDSWTPRRSQPSTAIGHPHPPIPGSRSLNRTRPRVD